MPRVASNPGKQVYDKIRRRPFAPFRITTRDGEQHLIGRPLQAAANDRIVVILPLQGDVSKTYRLSEIESVADVT